MSEKEKSIHNAYCAYEIAKANKPTRIYSVRAEVKRKQGIKTHNMSKAMLAQTLASLFQYTKGGKQMIYIVANGFEIIDPRPEAEIAQSERDYFEERYNRELKRKLEANTHPFAKKLLAACGLLQKGEYHYERIVTE